MKTNSLNITLKEPELLSLVLKPKNTFTLGLQTPVSGAKSYEKLTDKPSINGITLSGNLSSAELSLAPSSVKTTSEWNLLPTYIPALGEIVIYTDRNTIGDVVYQGIKIGDGLAYVVDLPFVGDDVYQMIINRIEDHVNNTNIHVTQDEKNKWNNKLNYSINDEELIFNTQ